MWLLFAWDREIISTLKFKVKGDVNEADWSEGKRLHESSQSQHTAEFCSKLSQIVKLFLPSILPTFWLAWLKLWTPRPRDPLYRELIPGSQIHLRCKSPHIRGVIPRDKFGHWHLCSALVEQEQLPWLAGLICASSEFGLASFSLFRV